MRPAIAVAVRILFVAAAAAIPPTGPVPQPVMPPQAAAQIDALVSAEQGAKKIPGVSIAVAFRDTLIYSKGYGLADLQHRVPVKTTTAFRTASVAKPLTAAGVMTLAEDGRLDLDGPIRKYCPAWPDTHPTITARQLLGHLAGVRHYSKAGESTGTTHYFSVGDTLALFKNDALLHEPGTKYSYSTYGYNLLGCVMEGASGTTYESFMRDRVFVPAGMTSTRLDRLYEIVPDRAAGYLMLTREALATLPASIHHIAKAGEVYNANLHDTSMKVPGGGLLSTAEDLVRFGIALNSGKLLKKETVERMWTEQKTADGSGTRYGLGFGVFPAVDGIRRVSHSGNQAGASSFLVILPEVGATYAIMTNLEDAELGTISRGIAGALRAAFMGKP